jgi:predicted phage terminase large subunit-like protein
MTRAIDPTYKHTPALEVIDQHLVALADRKIERLMVSMPPQEGKSEKCSRRFVEWMLSQDPDLRVAIVSYTDEMARRWGDVIKQDALTYNGEDDTPDLGIELRNDSRAAGRWQIKGHQGGVYCVGTGGSLTGKPVDLMVIDDPIKDLEQAQSSVYRERFRNFWQGVCVPRLGPGSRVVLIQTRWHEDDAAGWLLKQDIERAKEGEPTEWTVVSIPAVAEGPKGSIPGVDLSPGDPLGRTVGEPMVSARDTLHGRRDFAKIKRAVGNYVFAALYQQRPAPAKGGVFDRDKITEWHWNPDDVDGVKSIQVKGQRTPLNVCWTFMTMDLAASTKTSADYTVIGVWALDLAGNLILLDGFRDRVAPAKHWEAVKELRSRWGADTIYVESRMFGTTMVYEAGRDGIPLIELEADADKLTRALPASARTDRGELVFPDAKVYPWVTDWLDEMTNFPNAVHDDVVDVVAYAGRVAATSLNPLAGTELTRQMDRDTAYDYAQPEVGVDFGSAW